MKKFGLGKRHKLCSLTAIDCLFSAKGSSAAIAYPLRAVWRPGSRTDKDDEPVKFLISVPKKRLRHAVDRVAMRRRIREAYRLNHAVFESRSAFGGPVDVAFIYVADELKSFHAVQRSMCRLLSFIHQIDCDETGSCDKKAD